MATTHHRLTRAAIKMTVGIMSRGYAPTKPLIGDRPHHYDAHPYCGGMNRLALIAILAAGLALTACRSDAGAPTTTPTTRAPLGVVIAACRLEEDTVTLLNQANSARNLNGWTLHDEGRQNVLDLGFVFIDHAKTMVFMSGPDAMLEVNGRDEQWWPGAEDVWDDAGDTAYLLNQEGDIVDQKECT